MEVFSHFQHWHDVLCSPSGVVKSVTDRTKLFRYRWRGTRISPNLFPLEESSQLWKQRAHHLCNDPSRCDAASDYDGIRVISVIGPNDDPPRWALQSGSWGEPSAPAHTHTLNTGNRRTWKNAIVSIETKRIHTKWSFQNSFGLLLRL